MNAYFALGYACNHHCIFCPCGKKEDRRSYTPIPTEIVADYIQQVCANKDIKSITLSGGEPTMQSNFIEILDLLAETRLYVNVLTNSDYLSKESIFKQVVEHANPKQVRFTTALHSIYPQIHDKITGVKGSFERSVNTLQRLGSYGYLINIKHIIHRDSYKDLTLYLQKMIDIFPYNNVGFIFCGMDYCGMDTLCIDKCKVSFKEISPYLTDALSFFESYKQNRRLKITDIPLCTVDPYYWEYFSYAQRKSLSAYAAAIGGKPTYINQVKSDCDTFFQECKDCCVNHICPGVWKSAVKILGENAVKSIKPIY